MISCIESETVFVFSDSAGCAMFKNTDDTYMIGSQVQKNNISKICKLPFISTFNPLKPMLKLSSTNQQEE